MYTILLCVNIILTVCLHTASFHFNFPYSDKVFFNLNFCIFFYNECITSFVVESCSNVRETSILLSGLEKEDARRFDSIRGQMPWPDHVVWKIPPKKGLFILVGLDLEHWCGFFEGLFKREGWRRPNGCFKYQVANLPSLFLVMWVIFKNQIKFIIFYALKGT